MNTKNRRKKKDSSATVPPPAVERKIADVLRFTLDPQMNALRTNELPGSPAAPAKPAGNYMPFWDDGAWMPVRDGLSSGSLLDGEYTI